MRLIGVLAIAISTSTLVSGPSFASGIDAFWRGAPAISLQADINAPAAFERAASTSDASEVMRLVTLGFPVDHQDSAGRTALWYAVRSQQLDLMVRLLRAGADPGLTDQAGTSPLHLAAASGRAAALAAPLIAYGARLDVTDQDGQTPLMIVFGADRSGANTAWFLRQGADPFIPGPDGRTIADRARIHIGELVNSTAAQQGERSGRGGGLLSQALTAGATLYGGTEAGLAATVVSGGLSRLGDDSPETPVTAVQIDPAWAEIAQLINRVEANCRHRSAPARNCVDISRPAPGSLSVMLRFEGPGWP